MVRIAVWRQGIQSVEQVKQKLLSAIQQEKYQAEAWNIFVWVTQEVWPLLSLSRVVEEKSLLPLHRTWGKCIVYRLQVVLVFYFAGQVKKKNKHQEKAKLLDLLFPKKKFTIYQTTSEVTKNWLLWYLHRALYWSSIILNQNLRSF